MSVDLSDLEIKRIRGELVDPSSATSWFLLHYNPSSTSPALAVVASGHDPVLQQWKEKITKLQEGGESVAYGYGEFKGKGCILLFLDDSIAGVKRARAVVHSRAVAQLFPDYSALITISHLNQLTEALITEKLGLDYYQQPALPIVHPSSSPVVGDDRVPPPIEHKGELPAVPSSVVPSGSTVHSPDTAKSSPTQPSISTPVAFTQHRVPVPSSTGTSSRQVSGATPAHSPQNFSPSRHDRQMSGPEQSPDIAPDRQRKTSLGARLGKAFGNPSMQGRPSEHSSEGFSSSPSGSSKIMSSFTKAFRRTSGGSSPQHSPRADSHGAPPVPPKDDFPPRSAAPPAESSNGTYRTESGGMGYTPTSSTPRRSEDGASATFGSHPPVSSVSRLNAAQDEGNHLSPSPSAKRIMTEARIKSVSKEEEIQNRFRRDLHLEDKASGGREEMDDLDAEDDIRLPYDTSEHSLSDHLRPDGPDETIDAPLRSVETGQQAEHQQRNGADDKHAPISLGLPISHTGQHSIEAEPAAATDATVIPRDDSSQPALEQERHIEEEAPPATSTNEADSARLQEDEGRRESTEQHRLAALEADAAAVRQRQAEESAREEAEQRVAEQRIRDNEDRDKRDAEARHEAEAAAEVQRQAEEYAQLLEAKRLREQEEEEKLAAESRRIQLEEEQRKQAEEAERQRLALEEQRRLEEERLKEEEHRRHQEEIRRIEAEKQEAERLRKEGIKQSLKEGKQSGGVMLKGHVTVQTMKSPIWRRRFFRLRSSEMQLFKSETDEKPIQTIPLGQGVKIEHAYEESQVQGSWKIVSGPEHGEESFFVFADSPEEKETILEGLQIALT